MLHELAKEIGLNPKKASSSHGGVYCSPCPTCAGDNRFTIWSKTGRYYCRKCKRSGDTIQFCRDFMGMSFPEAKEKAESLSFGVSSSFEMFKPSPKLAPCASWNSKAQEFISSCHQRLLIDQAAMELLKKRGLTLETIRQHQIGWNSITTFARREDWGFEKMIENGREKKFFLPPGIVIPAFQNGALRMVKIRRNDWEKGAPFGKYYIVPGSIDFMPIFGNPDSPSILLVEAEFDAMLTMQEAGSICSCLALGGARKRPDELTHQQLQQSKQILFALDFDDGGKQAYHWWKTMYPQVQPWPVPEEKSPGDYFAKGGNLKEWLKLGLKHS